MRGSAKVFAGVVALGLAMTLSSCSTSSGDIGTGARSSSSAATGNDFSTAKSAAESYMRDVQNANLTQLVQLDNDNEAAKWVNSTALYAKSRVDDKAEIASWDITGTNPGSDGDTDFYVNVTTKGGESKTAELTVEKSDESDNLKRPYRVENALPVLRATDYIQADLDKYGDSEYDIVDHNTKIYLINKAGVKQLYKENQYLLPGTYKLEIMTDISEQHDDSSTDKSTFKKLASLDKTFTKELTLRG